MAAGARGAPGTRGHGAGRGRRDRRGHGATRSRGAEAAGHEAARALVREAAEAAGHGAPGHEA
jgi:hypothetical protein